jgi:hypothetical protein
VKKIWIKYINYAVELEPRNGSYYDWVAETWTNSFEQEQLVTKFLEDKGWQTIRTSDSLLIIYLKDRVIIRADRFWNDEDYKKLYPLIE